MEPSLALTKRASTSDKGRAGAEEACGRVGWSKMEDMIIIQSVKARAPLATLWPCCFRPPSYRLDYGVWGWLRGAIGTLIARWVTFPTIHFTSMPYQCHAARAQEMGHRWFHISKRLPGRTDHATRNRWHRLQSTHKEVRDWSCMDSVWVSCAVSCACSIGFRPLRAFCLRGVTMVSPLPYPLPHPPCTARHLYPYQIPIPHISCISVLLRRASRSSHRQQLSLFRP